MDVTAAEGNRSNFYRNAFGADATDWNLTLDVAAPGFRNLHRVIEEDDRC